MPPCDYSALNFLFRIFLNGVHRYLDESKLAAIFAFQRSHEQSVDISVADMTFIRQVHYIAIDVYLKVIGY